MQATLERLRQRREERGGEGGFTLIELLIVIVILGILAAIVVFAVQNLSGKSATSACQTDYKTAESAIEAYKAQVGHYPNTTDAAGLNNILTHTASGSGPWLKDSLKIATTDNYHFTYVGTTSTYTLTGHVGSSSANCAA